MGYSYEDTSDSEEGGAEEEPDAEEKLDAEEAVMEAQWKSYVDKLRQSGQLSSCLAVADVSGSMGGQPMNVCSSGPLPMGCHHAVFSLGRPSWIRSCLSHLWLYFRTPHA